MLFSLSRMTPQILYVDRAQVGSSPLTVIISGVFILLILLVSFYFLGKDKKLYQIMIDESMAGVYAITNGKLAFANKRVAEIFGYTAEEMNGLEIAQLFLPSDQMKVVNNIQKLTSKNASIIHDEYQCVRKDGSIITVEINGVVTKYNGEPAIMGTANDVTLKKNITSVINFYDPITKLPNQKLFNHLVTEHIENTNEPMSLVFIQLNRIADIQGSYGFEIGDKLVNHVIEHVQGLIKNNDLVTRYGETKLIVFLFNAGKSDGRRFAENVLALFKKPYHFENYYVMETVNIGISTYPELMTIEKLSEYAHIALHASLEDGPNQIRIFDDSLHQKMLEQASIESDLSHAFENNELIIYYQPKLDLLTGKISGLEALLRWNHPIKGIISPGVFIPIAEKNGLIIPLTNWVFRTISKCLEEMPEDISIAMNISPLHFLQPDFIKNVESLVELTGVDPKRMEIEITENHAINYEMAIKKLERLKELGFKISLDDFGSGYSSLGQVNRLPLDKLKIDQSFLRHQFSDPANRTVISSVIAMGHSLKYTVVAEGVETVDQLIFLQKHACDEVQGFLISRPLPADELLAKWDDIEKVGNY
ncbi:MAG: sensor domain-containing protein [Tuberibacillus sp.]